jgi:hypothetical protein
VHKSKLQDRQTTKQNRCDFVFLSCYCVRVLVFVKVKRAFSSFSLPRQEERAFYLRTEESSGVPDGSPKHAHQIGHARLGENDTDSENPS